MREMRKEYEEKVKAFILEILNKEMFPSDVNWKEDLTILGFDSISAIRFIVLLEDNFNIEFEDDFLMPENIFNFNNIMNYLLKKTD